MQDLGNEADNFLTLMLLSFFHYEIRNLFL